MAPAIRPVRPAAGRDPGQLADAPGRRQLRGPPPRGHRRQRLPIAPISADLFRLNTNLIYTHNLKISNFENPALPDFENRILGELGDPKDEFRWDVDLTRGPFTFGYRMRYIGPMFTGLYENFNELSGACSGTPTGLPAEQPR